MAFIKSLLEYFKHLNSSTLPKSKLSCLCLHFNSDSSQISIRHNDFINNIKLCVSQTLVTVTSILDNNAREERFIYSSFQKFGALWWWELSRIAHITVDKKQREKTSGVQALSFPLLFCLSFPVTVPHLFHMEWCYQHSGKVFLPWFFLCGNALSDTPRGVLLGTSPFDQADNQN
jgi:hypothetical protein